jgi:HD-GYP domain-containing protein (c-di-GMP phosphodiesterase class II)
MRSAASRKRASSAARAAALHLSHSRRGDIGVVRPEEAASAEALLALVAERVPRLESHHRAVGELAGEVARELGLPEAEREAVVRAARMHDVGKVVVPRSILDKTGPLNAHELEIMREHSVAGQRMLDRCDGLGREASLVRSTHERWDGSGYPDALAGEEIPLGARIIAVCDAYDAMTSERPYRPARSPRRALAEVRRGAGRRYDPRIVPAFLAAVARLSGRGPA